MRIVLVAVTTLLFSAAATSLTTAQEQPKDNSKYRTPVMVRDLVDACGEALNQMDNHPTQNSAANLMKIGWCLGWVQALQERIVEVHAYARVEEMNAKKEGRAARASEGADKDYMSICIPGETRTGDLIRVLVKDLGDSPLNIQNEPKNGPVKAALQKAYPCPAAAPTAGAADTKP
jgi:hypothetical protein